MPAQPAKKAPDYSLYFEALHQSFEMEDDITTTIFKELVALGIEPPEMQRSTPASCAEQVKTLIDAAPDSSRYMLIYHEAYHGSEDYYDYSHPARLVLRIWEMRPKDELEKLKKQKDAAKARKEKADAKKREAERIAFIKQAKKLGVDVSVLETDDDSI